MQFNGDGTGQRLFALDACSDRGENFVDLRIAQSRNSTQTMVMDVELALAAYEWLGRWLAAQGAIIRP